jgi:F-type H+-transporting ATPase subunit gamma
VANTKIIQRRIRSVKNAKQITKALEVVAASRMRKVAEAVEKAATYGRMADAIMRRIAPSQEAKLHPYFRESDAKSKLYIIFTSDRGQAGAFNSNIFHQSIEAFKEDKARGGKAKVIVFGRKGARFFSRLEDIELIAEFEDVADIPETNIFAPVLDVIRDQFGNQFGGVEIIYTSFISSLSQKAVRFQLLPVQPVETEANEVEKVYEFEPEVGIVLEEAVRLYFEAKLMQSRIESATSEHAMRMVAMGNANRNASDLIDDLTLEFNATRQAAITQEIAEITGGAEAISQ